MDVGGMRLGWRAKRADVRSSLFKREHAMRRLRTAVPNCLCIVHRRHEALHRQRIELRGQRGLPARNHAGCGYDRRRCRDQSGRCVRRIFGRGQQGGCLRPEPLWQLRGDAILRGPWLAHPMLEPTGELHRGLCFVLGRSALRSRWPLSFGYRTRLRVERIIWTRHQLHLSRHEDAHARGLARASSSFVKLALSPFSRRCVRRIARPCTHVS